MKHILHTNNFTLEIELQVFEKDFELPVNAILNISVQSDGFGAKTTMDIDVKELSKFAFGLKNLYDILIGTIRLEEPYGLHNYIEFSGNGNGYINVVGVLNNYCRNGLEQELQFRNEFDQTYLNEFANELCFAYSKFSS